MSNFVEELNQNTRQATVMSLLETVSSESNRTIGEIIDALNEDPETDYMLDIFRSFTVAQLAQAVNVGKPPNGKKVKPAAKASSEDEEEAIEVEATPPKRKSAKGKKSKSGKGKKGKGKAKTKTDKRAKADKAPKKGGGGGGATKGAVKRVLKRSDEALTVSDIARELEVESDEIKPILADLLEADAIVKEGKARGTRYSMA